MTSILYELIIIILCHVIGDYLFQSDYLAENKGKDWYILIVHCLLYTVPFVFTFGTGWQWFVLFGTHIIIDTLKARYNKINIIQDQLLHYIIATVLYVIIPLI